MLTDKAGNFGDLHTRKIIIDGEDISKHVRLIKIYQDIFTPCWTAIIAIEDSSNLLMNLPIQPGSEIAVSIETNDVGALDGSAEYEFVIYKISDKEGAGQMHQRYNLYCATEAFVRNMSARVQKAYSNLPAEQIAGKVLQDYLGGQMAQVDETPNLYHLIVPNWSPLTAISWCLKIAVVEGASDFVFFMKEENQYWFKRFEKLYTGENTGVVLTQKPSNLRGDNREYDEDYTRMITKYEFDHYDGLANLGTGMYKNKLVSFNLITKGWEETVFTYGQDVAEDQQKKAWDSSLFDDAENSNISFHPKHDGANSNGVHDSSTAALWHGSRLTNLLKFEQDKLRVQLPGGAKAQEWLGLVTTIELPSHQDLSESDDYDKYFRGDYLIGSICHMIEADYYTLNLECYKKRLNEKM
jgi:hypothetical protein